MSRPLLLALFLTAGCSKAEPPTVSDHKLRTPGEGMSDLPVLESGKVTDDYIPSASELPLTEDFAAAANKRVTPDNYRKELVTIERELDQLSGKR